MSNQLSQRDSSSGLDGLRIGYAPYRPDMDTPGDRRRFGFFAARRGLEFEIARPGQNYDLLVLSPRADITWWSRTPGETAIVYDLIDSYLALPQLRPSSLGRGLVKFVSRETSRFAPSYLRAIRGMCRRADAVVCSTLEQRADIMSLCPNVHVILDSFTEVTHRRKVDFGLSGDVFNLVWEGLPYTLSGFRVIEDVLRELGSERNLAVHLITDLRFKQYAGRFVRRDSARIASRMMDYAYLYQWNQQMLAPIATACDLAVIPLDRRDPLAWGKPENKLLLLWRLGIPAIVSATPAYRRTMDACGLPMHCDTADEWRTKLRLFMSSENLRADAGHRGAAYAEATAGDDVLLAAWDAAVGSALDVSRRRRRALP